MENGRECQEQTIAFFGLVETREHGRLSVLERLDCRRKL